LFPFEVLSSATIIIGMKHNIIVSPDSHTPMPLSYYVEHLQITSRSNLWRWTKEGLKTIRIGGRVYISQAELQRFMNEGARKPVAE
jgi:hypothetical protein